MTTTDTELEFWEMVAMAVAEIDGTVGIRAPLSEKSRFAASWWAKNEMIRKAANLVDLARSGPETPVVCSLHYQPGRPDLWDACLKVRVMDALNGLTCDTHGLLNSEAAA